MGREAARALAAIGALASPAGTAASAVDGAAEVPGVWSGFRLLGSGACRTASGDQGDFSMHWGPMAAEDCERRCVRDADCLGYEVTFSNESSAYNPGVATACEIHRKEVVSTTDLTDVECWSKGGAGGQRRYVLVGTGRCLGPADADERPRPSPQVAGARRCRAECNAQEGCVAYDVAAEGQQEECRLHMDPITQVEPCEGSCWCWARKPRQSGESPARAATVAAESPPPAGGAEPAAGPLPIFQQGLRAVQAELGMQAEFGQGGTAAG